ncbi:potassium voltage-gated channel subfamily C member 3-like [Lineus longissimus]|uniref:potassium voltage-gated channel subfamily C member 3-like n=1 Tax=Lineus longissimus TaxID=88925 RepID=UPI00315C7725
MAKRIFWEKANAPSGTTDAEVSERDVLNFDIRGVKFELLADVVDEYPDTTLGRLAEQYQHLPELERNVVYVFDRDPNVFKAVIQFYKTGELHHPSVVCATIFKRDIEFWRITCPVAPCCSPAYQEAHSNTDVIRQFKETIIDEKNLLSDYVFHHNGRRWRPRLWYFMTYPSSSLGAKVYAVFVYLLVVLNMIRIIVEQNSHSFSSQLHSITSNLTDEEDVTDQEDTILCKVILSGYLGTSNFIMAFNIADMVVGVIFAFDNFLRLISAPKIKTAFLSYRNIVECVCLFPSLAFFLYWQGVVWLQSCDHSSATWIPLLWHLKQLRGLQLCVLLIHYMPCRVLFFVIKYNVKQGMISVFFLAVFTFTLTMGALVLVFERLGSGDWKSEDFNTAFDAYWWVIITMTTVGYGDVVPHSSLGKVIGVVCALSGILLLAVMVPLMTNNFTVVLNYSRDLDIHPRKDSSNEDKRRKSIAPGETYKLIKTKSVYA